jgi:hypothetical protein
MKSLLDIEQTLRYLIDRACTSQALGAHLYGFGTMDEMNKAVSEVEYFKNPVIWVVRPEESFLSNLNVQHFGVKIYFMNYYDNITTWSRNTPLQQASTWYPGSLSPVFLHLDHMLTVYYMTLFLKAARRETWFGLNDTNLKLQQLVKTEHGVVNVDANFYGISLSFNYFTNVNCALY